jgi:hypothetical protein
MSFHRRCSPKLCRGHSLCRLRLSQLIEVLTPLYIALFLIGMADLKLARLTNGSADVAVC